MEIPLLRDILVIFSLSIVVLLICHKLRLPLIVGYLITGVVGGPGGFGFVKGVTEVETLSEIGIVLLLFTVGLEFSLKKILEYKRYFFLGGFLQVILTILAGYAVASIWEHDSGEAIFIGFLLSLSSTAIVLKILQNKNETATPHGKSIIGILVFQDVVAILMILLTPVLAGEAFVIDWKFLGHIVGGVAILSTVFVTSIFLVPRILYMITKTRSKELFLLSVIVICFSVAYLSSLTGLSLSIGAFLAGMIIADSEYSLEAIGDILPFRDIFTSFFFVSTGMLLNVSFIMQYPLLILAFLTGIVLLKSVIATGSVLAVGLPLRSAVIAGLSLAQIGEFSLVLCKQGLDAGLVDNYFAQIFLDISVLSMAITPLLINLAEPVAQTFLKLPLPARLKTGIDHTHEKIHYRDHVMIIGYGISGKNIVRSLKEATIPYVILEMNSETVKREKKLGQPIYYGDASHETVLVHLGIHHAKALAVVINDVVAAKKTVETARRINPSLYIIVRTPRVSDMNDFFKLGATDVIPDEFGTSIEIFSRVLRMFQVTREEIDRLIASLRHEGYELIRDYYREPSSLKEFHQELSEVKLETFRIENNSPLIGETVVTSNIKSKYDLTVMMIKRGEMTLSNIHADTKFEKDDRVVLMGQYQNLKRVYELFKPSSSV